MQILAVAVLVVAAAAPAPSRTFWKTDVGVAAQPVQSRVTADRVAEGEHIEVYEERGYSFSTTGREDEQAQLAAIVKAFDTVIFPGEVALFGTCPDVDGNGRVIVLVTPLARSPSLFFRFDEMDEATALRYGFHSNQGEVLYHSFVAQGDRAGRNIADLARTFHQLLEFAHSPADTSWSLLGANFEPFHLGLSSARSLWGGDDPLKASPEPSVAWDPSGWPILFFDYLATRLGEGGLADLLRDPQPGFSAVSTALRARGQAPVGADDALADFAMACWLDDPVLGGGRFSFPDVTPPRPGPVATLSASRPTAGQALVGVGGVSYLVVLGDAKRSLPLSLRGDPRARWVARAVHLRPEGPDHEVPVTFDATGAARLDLSFAQPGDGLVVAVVPIPADDFGLDHRQVLLQWGLGWVPASEQDREREGFQTALAKAFPDDGVSARARLLATVDRLAGLRPGADGSVVTTRYAWAPEAAEVVKALRDETVARGLKAKTQTFPRIAPGEISQQWQNVLIELPGSDPRRWPVVLAAHWDGDRSRLDDAYLRAVNIDDDAAGVAVALESAAAMARMPHRAPILVALLDGGYHHAAGAQALLEQLQARVTAWVELDGVGIPMRWPHQASIRLEGAGKLESLIYVLSQALKHGGLVPKTFAQASSDHSALSLPVASRFPAVLVRCREGGPDRVQLDLPPAVERQELSPDMMVLLAKALANGIVQLAGASQ
jgi:hypothetical protein